MRAPNGTQCNELLKQSRPYRRSVVDPMRARLIGLKPPHSTTKERFGPADEERAGWAGGAWP